MELRTLNPSGFRFSALRFFDPATPTPDIDATESHFKNALDSRRNGLNRSWPNGPQVALVNERRVVH